MSKQDTRQNAQGGAIATATIEPPSKATDLEKPSQMPSSAAGTGLVLSDEEKERIRRVAAAGTGRKFGLARLPDGSFRLDVTIPVEIALMLESQAECAGEDLEQFIQRNVVEALTAYVASQG